MAGIKDVSERMPEAGGESVSPEDRIAEIEIRILDLEEEKAELEKSLDESVSSEDNDYDDGDLDVAEPVPIW